MITGMDRLAAAISGSPCDRIPVFSIMLDQGAREMGMSLRDYYSKGEYVAEGQLRLRARYGYDNLWTTFYVGREAELLGCKRMLYSDDGPPNVGDMVIRSPDDIHKLEIPANLEDHPAFAEPLKCQRILRAEAGGRYPICANLTASMGMPAILMGMEKWIEMVVMGPADLRDELLTKCSDFVRAQFAVLNKAGADVIVYANPFASTEIVPLKLIRELSLPWMRRDLEGFPMDKMVYYGGGTINPSLGLAIEELGFKCFYLSPWDDIAEAKRIVAGRGLIGGAFNDLKLLNKPEKEIREDVRRMLAAGMPGGQFFFGTLLMPYRIPERNIRIMFEAAYEFGALGVQ
jgi:uroporphyrinogen-III decarboxylase